MSSRNGGLKLVAGVCVTGIIAVLLALFSFSNQRTSQALEIAVQARERNSVIESQIEEIKVRQEEQREDSKEIKATLSEMRADIQTLINR